MKKNEVLELTCEGIGTDMEGVARWEGRPVFVPGLLPGEKAPVRIVKVAKSYAFGRIAGAIGNAWSERKEPDCPAFPRCGGCTCRHMTYRATLDQKRRRVEDCFKRIGHIDTVVLPVLGMDDPYAYRNKTALPVGGEPGKPVIGFYAPRSHTIVPAVACPNAMPPADRAASALKAWMESYLVAPYIEEGHTGLVRHLVTRVSRSGEALAVVVINGNAVPEEKALADAMREAGIASLVVNRNTDRTNVILGPDYRIVFGKGFLTDTLCGLRFELSPAAFFQVNPVQTEKLYNTALEFAELRPEDTLCDVYCGAGTITLMMAGRARRAVGIEIVPQAVKNAGENALRNKIFNAEFYQGAAEAVLPELVRSGLRPDVIVVDPPRKGLDPAVIGAMAAASPRRIVYVSCDPATLARDAALLSERGYVTERVQPVDMFCWTSGVENVALLVRDETGQ